MIAQILQLEKGSGDIKIVLVSGWKTCKIDPEMEIKCEKQKLRSWFAL